MTHRILIVEDEIFVAIEIEQVVQELGHDVVGLAGDAETALKLSDMADIALVDLNLRDGPTGIGLGSQLAAAGKTVVFLTANPSQLGDGVPGALGVISKPLSDNELRQAISFAVARANASADVQPPERFHLFTMSQDAGSRQASM